jgi:hypothetical protein
MKKYLLAVALASAIVPAQASELPRTDDDWRHKPTQYCYSNKDGIVVCQEKKK